MLQHVYYGHHLSLVCQHANIFYLVQAAGNVNNVVKFWPYDGNRFSYWITNIYESFRGEHEYRMSWKSIQLLRYFT